MRVGYRQGALSHSLLNAVDLMGRGGNASRRVPNQVELLFLGQRGATGRKLRIRFWLILTLSLCLLLESALQSVAILEEPGAGALWFVVLEATLEVDAVGIDPLALQQLALGPLTSHFHARCLEDVGAVALLLTVLPPAGVDIAIDVSESALTVTTAILPVAVVLADISVDLLADAALHVLFPAALVAVARLHVAIDAGAGADPVDEVALVNVAIVVESGTVACETARGRLHLVVLGPQLVGALFSVL